MVVLVIIGLLAGLVGPRLFGKVDTSKVQTAETQIKMLRGALQAYRLDIGRYPSTAEGLAALMQAPPEDAAFWSGPYLDDDLPLDPWRTPYRYAHPADNLQGFALYSLGADSAVGGQGGRCRHRLSAEAVLMAVAPDPRIVNTWRPNREVEVAVRGPNGPKASNKSILFENLQLGWEGREEPLPPTFRRLTSGCDEAPAPMAGASDRDGSSGIRVLGGGR